MSNNSPRFNTLFQLYLDNSITHIEYQELLLLLNADTNTSSLNAALKELWVQSGIQPMGLPKDEWDNKIQSLIQNLHEDIPAIPVRKISNFYRLKWAAAAVFLLLLSSGIYYILKPSKYPLVSNNMPVKRDTSTGVLPGGNKAVLILADGTSIFLDSTSRGTIAKQGAAKVTKSNAGELVYNSSDNAGAGAVLYNTLITPVGGQYRVTLSDGTDVWLNSGSSLRYPTVFTGVDRTVQITGEAYFEVAKNLSQPFKVKINTQGGDGGEVEVLGTHFNINAYDNETTVRTTLLEGKVKVNVVTGSTQIRPGQQLQVDRLGKINLVNDADLEEAIAWKEGKFHFENADINSVMRQLARWYDIDVEYNGNITRHFGGTISRNVNVLKVLNMLELTGEINFKVEGKKVIIMP